MNFRMFYSSRRRLSLCVVLIITVLTLSNYEWHKKERAHENILSPEPIQPLVIRDKTEGDLSSVGIPLQTNAGGELSLLGISLGESGKDVVTGLQSEQGAHPSDIVQSQIDALVSLRWQDPARGVLVLLQPPDEKQIEPYGHVVGVYYTSTRLKPDGFKADLARRWNALYRRADHLNPNTLAKELPWCVPVGTPLGSDRLAELFFANQMTLVLESDPYRGCS